MSGFHDNTNIGQAEVHSVAENIRAQYYNQKLPIRYNKYETLKRYLGDILGREEFYIRGVSLGKLHLVNHCTD
jgi:hypothetical protein